MKCTVERYLLERLDKAGISRRELANLLDRNYSTVVCWLNGYNKLPDKYRDWINRLIDERIASRALDNLLH